MAEQQKPQTATDTPRETKAEASQRREAPGSVSDISSRQRETTRESLDRMAEAGRHLAETGAQTATEGQKAGQMVARTALDTSREMGRATVSPWNRMIDFGSPETRATVERVVRDMLIATRCGDVVIRHSQPLMEEMMAYVRQTADAQVKAWNRVQQARSPIDLLAAQGDLMRQSMTLWVNSSHRLGAMMRTLGEQAGHIIDEEERQADRRFKALREEEQDSDRRGRDGRTIDLRQEEGERQGTQR